MNLIKTLFGGGSAAVSPEQVTEHLKSCLDPNTGKDLVSAKAIKNLKIDGGRVSWTWCWATRRARSGRRWPSRCARICSPWPG